MSSDSSRGPAAGRDAPSSSSTPAMEHYWSQAAESAAPRISQIRRRLSHFPSAALRIQRVSQLDAELLDAELLTMLLEPVKASLAQIKSTLPERLEPELMALLKLVLFKYSIWDKGASYGAMLQNLRYRNEWAHKGGLQSTFLSAPLSKVQLLLYPVLTIGIPYAHDRLHREMTSTSFSDLPASDPRRLLYWLSDKVQRIHEAAALANFLAFLGDGKYRTVTDRLLGMRLTYASRALNRNVSFEFLNRQLVWHAFTEFLLFLLPIIRPRRLLRRLMRLPTHPRILSFWLLVLPQWLSRRVGLHRDQAGRPKYRLPFNIPLLNNAASRKGKGRANSNGKHAELPQGICPICWERIEAENASAAGGGALSLGIPTSDPLDPSSSALAPSASAAAASHARTQQYQTASRAFGVSSEGVPYSVALLHTPYRAKPCGCEYCYVCLAEKLLSEEAGEEWEDSRTAAGSSGAVVEKGRKNGSGKSSGHHEEVGAWDCLRCASKVRGMERAEQDEEEKIKEDEDQAEEEGQASRLRPLERSSPNVSGDADSEEVLDLDELR